MIEFSKGGQYSMVTHFEMGMIAGEKVASEVNAFIKRQRKLKPNDNFDPKHMEVLPDGTTVYQWIFKYWDPGTVPEEKEFFDLLSQFDDDNLPDFESDSVRKQYAFRCHVVHPDEGWDGYYNDISDEFFSEFKLTLNYPNEWVEKRNAEFKVYDSSLIEYPVRKGMYKYDYLALHDGMKGRETFPVEIRSSDGKTAARGFIGKKAAEKLQYQYGQDSGFGKYISSILDSDERNPACQYEFEGLHILMVPPLMPWD